MTITEATVEDAALAWFAELGYAVAHGPDLAPGEPAAERDSFGDVVLVGRLRDAIARLNPLIPEQRILGTVPNSVPRAGLHTYPARAHELPPQRMRVRRAQNPDPAARSLRGRSSS